MDQSPSSSDFGDRLRRREPGADESLLRRYAGRLIALARRQLGERLRGKVDPEDVLQSVLRSFYRRHADDHWRFTDEKGLWRLLVQLTVRKCRRRIEYFQAARRDVRREVGSDDERLAFDPEPTPAEAAAVSDLIEGVMRRLGTEVKRRIFELSLQGYGVVEISRQVGYYERGVERVRAEIRSLLEAMMADGPPTPG